MDEPLGTDVAGQGFIGNLAEGVNAQNEPILNWWSVGRLWRLADALPPADTPLSRFDFFFDMESNLAASVGGRPITYRDVAKKAQRIANADLQYPIILMTEHWIVDGNHRLMKAYALGLPTIRVVRFPEIPVPDFTGSANDLQRTKAGRLPAAP